MPPVARGWITLHGEVDGDFQRRHAEKAASPLRGVAWRRAPSPRPR
ncbi:BON domain-containing protein [Aquabacterium humicola]|nr:BON domain-containing protein [Rubrivivax pictus]